MNIQELIAEALEFARGMWRYRWWAAGCAWLLAIPGWLYVYSMPDVYSASARVYVDTQSLMQPIFEGLAVPDNLAAQVEAVSRALLTRPNLEEVARSTDLDLRVNSPAQMEFLITRLQERIRVEGSSLSRSRSNSEQNVFTISYEDRDRDKAREVVAAVVDAFVENSLHGQGKDAERTGRALEAEIRDHEGRLLQAEQQLAQFQKDNLGYMPDDRGNYHERLQAAMNAVGATESQLRQVRERRDELDRQIAQSVFGAVGDGPASVGCTQQPQIAQLESELALLRVDFTEQHPSIVSMKEIIAQLQVACGEQRKAAAAAGRPATILPEQSLNDNLVYQNLGIQLTNAEVEIAGLVSQLNTHRTEVAQLRADVDKIADVEASLKQLNRDYGVIQQRYQELLVRREQLESMERLDPVTGAMQFRTLEPPFAGIAPVGPNRPLLLAGVLVAALAAGGALAFGLNQLKPVFFTRRALQKLGGLPVLGSVSLLRSPEQIRKRRADALLWGSACASLFFLMVLMVMFEGPGSAFIQQLSGGSGA